MNNFYCMRDASRVLVCISYDGTDFAGFQIQSQARTVQGELERGITNYVWYAC